MHLSVYRVFNYRHSVKRQLCENLSLTLSAKIKKTSGSKDIRINILIDVIKTIILSMFFEGFSHFNHGNGKQ